ncbi:hypothetical protein BDZ94DRAFT_1258159 [Collybia nuda]|uniref:Uncharacterized protein n=1 Tax=Collybia nuda TaxID=64659 RepID=A0A9P5Y7E3_9AGAR|nr:hypothetical protein BDZ94DRAFT_1258159 [Collybia nuda]
MQRRAVEPRWRVINDDGAVCSWQDLLGFVGSFLFFFVFVKMLVGRVAGTSGR